MKRMMLVALVALAAFALAASSADAASPIHWWKADGDANDSAGTNNGTLENGATFAAGESGQAFSLDGVNQYVSVPDDPSHYFSGSFTIDAWEKTTANTGLHFILSIYECGNSCPPGANSEAELAVSDGQAFGDVRDSTGAGPTSGGQVIQGGPNVADGAWHHLVFIRDVANAKLLLSVDGVTVEEDALNPGVAGALHNDDGEADPLTIGAAITGGSSAPQDLFSGLIDDVKLFDVAVYPTPTNTAPPSISGTPAVGQTLTCNNGSWNNFPTGFSYQWNRDGIPISGATGQMYTVGAADQGHTLTCSVVATNEGGSGSPSTSAGVAVPSAAGAPVNTAAPSISGTPTPPHVLTCSPGSWSNNPTAFLFQWYRNGRPIPGATRSKYEVQVSDEASTLTCQVTAKNAAGSSVATSSAGVLVAVKGTLTCPKPTGRIGGLAVGPLSLGMTRAAARHTLHRFAVTRNGFDDFCLFAGWGIRVGYPSHRLLAPLAHSLARRVAGRVVIALTANPFYALNGVRPGMTLAAAARKLKLGKSFHIGLNFWYLAPAGRATGVLKVRSGIVQEVGLADRRVTEGRKAQARFMNSFG